MKDTLLLTVKRMGINGEGIAYYKRRAIFNWSTHDPIVVNDGSQVAADKGTLTPQEAFLTLPPGWPRPKGLP